MGLILIILAALTLAVNSKRLAITEPTTDEWHSLDKRKPEEIYAYRRRMNDKIKQLENLGTPERLVRATITFTRPLSVEEKNDLKRDYKIKGVYSHTIKLSHNDILRDTSYTVEEVKNNFMDLISKLPPNIWWGGMAGDKASTELLERSAKYSDEGQTKNPPVPREDPLTFVGLEDLYGWVPINQLKKLSDDDRVFLVDVSYDEFFIPHKKDLKLEKWEGFVGGLFGSVAYLGLTKDEKGGQPPVFNREAWTKDWTKEKIEPEKFVDYIEDEKGNKAPAPPLGYDP